MNNADLQPAPAAPPILFATHIIWSLQQVFTKQFVTVSAFHNRKSLDVKQLKSLSPASLNAEIGINAYPALPSFFIQELIHLC